MIRSFFLKYQDYKIGFRFTYNAGHMSFQHCVEAQPDDEVFRWFAGLKAFQARLIALYGTEQGNDLFLHVFSHLLSVAEREYIKNERRGKKK